MTVEQYIYIYQKVTTRYEKYSDSCSN